MNVNPRVLVAVLVVVSIASGVALVAFLGGERQVKSSDFENKTQTESISPVLLEKDFFTLVYPSNLLVIDNSAVIPLTISDATRIGLLEDSNTMYIKPYSREQNLEFTFKDELFVALENEGCDIVSELVATSFDEDFSSEALNTGTLLGCYFDEEIGDTSQRFKRVYVLANGRDYLFEIEIKLVAKEVESNLSMFEDIVSSIELK